MSLKKTLTDRAFKRDEVGRMIVYLYGRTGYFVPDDATEQKLRTTRIWLIVASLIASFAIVPIMIISFGQIYDWPLAAWCIAIGALAMLDIGQRAVVRVATRGMTPAGRIGMREAFRQAPEAAPRFWRWFMWYCIVSAPIVFLGSVVYLATGTWLAGYVFALGGVVFSACMMLGGICGLRWRPQS